MRCSAFTIAGLVFVIGIALSAQLLADDETLEQRRGRLEQMSDAEKTRLLEKKRRFDDLSRAEKKRYRELHQELVSDGQYKQLRGTLQRYSDWLKTLDPLERDELSKLPAKDRLERVKQLMDTQSTERFRLMVSEVIQSNYLLSREDLNAICEWTDQFLRDHHEEILTADPDDRFAAELLADYDPEQHIHFLRMKYFRPGFRPFRDRPPDGHTRKKTDPRDNTKSTEEPQLEVIERLPKPSSEDVAELEREISREAREVLKKATEEGERSQIVQNWMRAAVFSRFMPPVSPADLEEFVASDELAGEEREWLESLPRDRMFHELRKLYFRKKFQRGRWGGRRRDGGGGRYGRDGKPDGPGFERGRGPRGAGPGQQNRGPENGRRGGGARSEKNDG